MGVSVCRKTSIVIKKWGLGRSPKQGEGGSPTLSPFPRGRGLGIGIENLLYFYKYRLFLQTESDRVFLSDLFLYAFKIPFGSVLECRTFFILRVSVKAKLSGVIGNRVIFKSGKFS